MKKDIMKKYSDKLAFFAVKVPIHSITDKTVSWLGKDYHEFFDIAVKAGVKMIYYYRTFPDADKIEIDATELDKIDITELDFGFMHDGIMHILIAYSDLQSLAKMAIAKMTKHSPK